MADLMVLLGVIDDFCEKYFIPHEDQHNFIADILRCLDVSLTDKQVRQIEEVISRDI